MPLRLSGRVQRPLCCGEEARPFLWNLPARESHFLLQRHDAGDGDGWGDAELRICGLFQSNPTLWLDYTLTLPSDDEARYFKKHHISLKERP